MDLPAHFGKYLLVHQLGRGGMAELFLAKQSGLKGFEKVLAIKKILPHLTQDPEFVSMFVNEGKLAALLTHQHIVQIFDLGHVEGAYYMAMEYVMGKDVRSLVGKIRERGGRLSIDHALLIVSQVASGLDYAHRKKDLNGRELNIVHRDVSPQNILVSYEGEVKLVDFGIAKAAGSGQETQTGILKGKLAYMSPEQACGRAIDRRSDVFSLGIVLYELLTGRRLFKGDSDLSTLEQVRTAHVEPPRTLDGDIPESLEAVALKALAREADQRYQTASEFQAALERILAERGQGTGSLNFAQYLATIFAEEMRADAERFQSAHQETVRMAASAPRPVAAPARRHDTPRPSAPARLASRPLPAPESHGVRSALVGAVLLFVLGSATVVSTPAVLRWLREQPADLRRVGSLVEERLGALGLRRLVPDPESAAPAAQPTGMAAADAAQAEPIAVPAPVTDVPTAAAFPARVAPIEPQAAEAIAPPVPAAEAPREPPPVHAAARASREDVKPLLRRAQTLYAEGRLDEVEDVLRTVIERDPHSPLAYHLLGTVYLERKDEDRAFKLFSEGAHQFPNHAALHYDLGFLYARRGLGSLAREELSRAVALQPEGVQADRARRLLHGGPAGAPRAGLRRPPPPLEPADRPAAMESAPQDPPAAPGESPAEAAPDGAPDGQPMEER